MTCNVNDKESKLKKVKTRKLNGQESKQQVIFLTLCKVE